MNKLCKKIARLNDESLDEEETEYYKYGVKTLIKKVWRQAFNDSIDTFYLKKGTSNKFPVKGIFKYVVQMFHQNGEESDEEERGAKAKAELIPL